MKGYSICTLLLMKQELNRTRGNTGTIEYNKGEAPLTKGQKYIHVTRYRHTTAETIKVFNCVLARFMQREYLYNQWRRSIRYKMAKWPLRTYLSCIVKYTNNF